MILRLLHLTKGLFAFESQDDIAILDKYEHEEDLPDMLQNTKIKIIGDQQRLSTASLQEICDDLQEFRSTNTNDNVKMKSISDRLQRTINDICTSSQTQQSMLFELLNSKIEDLEEDAEARKLDKIRDGDLNRKATLLQKDMDLIRKQRAIPAKDENKFAHAVRWSSYYISDHEPLAYAALTLQAIASTALAELMHSEYCSATYQIVEWSIFVIASLFLVSVAGNSFAQLEWDGYLKGIMLQWCIFDALLLSTTSFPPLQCYTDSHEYFTGLGILSLVVATLYGYFCEVYQGAYVSTGHYSTDYTELQGEDDKMDLNDDKKTYRSNERTPLIQSSELLK